VIYDYGMKNNFESAPPAGNEKKQRTPEEYESDARFIMNSAERRLSEDYEIAAKRMVEMKIVGDIELSWEGPGSTHKKPVLEGVVNGARIRIEGAPSGLPSQILRVPTEFPTAEFSGTVNEAPLSSADAQYLFGRLMGIAISKDQKETAQKMVAEDSADHFVRMMKLRPGEEVYPYPGVPEPEYKKKKRIVE